MIFIFFYLFVVKNLVFVFNYNKMTLVWKKIIGRHVPFAAHRHMDTTLKKNSRLEKPRNWTSDRINGHMDTCLLILFEHVKVHTNQENGYGHGFDLWQVIYIMLISSYLLN